MKISRNRTVLCGLVDEDVSYRNCDREPVCAPSSAGDCSSQPTFPGFPVVVGRRVARSGVSGNGKRASRPQEAVETPGDCAEVLELVALPASEDAIYPFNLADESGIPLGSRDIFSTTAPLHAMQVRNWHNPVALATGRPVRLLG
jgi:hypothetical protein